jgi:hypothetical protein
MKRFLVLMGVGALASVALAHVSDVIARDGSVNAGGVSASRDGVSAGGVSASRDGVSAGGVSASRDGVSAGGVSASRDGASVRDGGRSVSASRDGASVRDGGTSVSASRDDFSTGSVNARGDREYDSLASWIEDMGRWFQGKPTVRSESASRTSSVERKSSNSSSVKQVSKATSTEGGSAVASNTNVTTQK